MQKIETEKKHTNTPSAGTGTTPEGMAPKNGVLHNSIAPKPFNVFGSPDDELQQLADEPLFKMYAEVGPELYEIISRTNPTLKAVVDLAKDICEGGQ